MKEMVGEEKPAKQTKKQWPEIYEKKEGVLSQKLRE